MHTISFQRKYVIRELGHWEIELAKLNLEALRQYYVNSEQQLAKELKDFEEKATNTGVKMPTTDSEEATNDQLELRHQELTEEHPQMIRTMAFIAGYRIFESALRKVYLGEFERDALTKAPDGKRKYQHALAYLRLKFPTLFGAVTWARVTDYQKVRDLLMHADGVVTEMGKPTMVEAAISKCAGLGVRDGVVSFERPAVEPAIRCMETFLDALDAEVK